ncbi:MAG TPA: pitrilysin family protein [Cytophagaceae bacterium]
MIAYKNFTLDNGLKVFVHEDKTSPLAVVNILYNVGSKDEDENKTGFAHLFEHLMFGGSKHIASYDQELQRVGGENNAFTSTDITNYYITLPSANLETALWLESDRMLSLSFDPKVLEVQRNVVVEEFKQRYFNQPYGDVWLKLRPLAYKVHPYRWPTIGKEIAHIEKATMEDVREFFFKYYIPNNAVMVVAGDVDFTQVKSLTEKYFAPIPSGKPYLRSLPAEPVQKEERFLETEANVPLDAIYKVYHMVGKLNRDYYVTDLMSDILGRGKSSRLYDTLVKGKKLFNSVSAYVTGSVEPGLLVVEGKLNQGVKIEDGEKEINAILEQIRVEAVGEEELNKVKNQAESTLIFGEVELLNRAMNLAYGVVLGDPELVNKESELIQSVTSEDILRVAKEVLRRDNCSTLYYRAKK